MHEIFMKLYEESFVSQLVKKKKKPNSIFITSNIFVSVDQLVPLGPENWSSE